MDELTNLYVVRKCVELGYPILESYLSTIDICDRALICLDPTDSPETIKLINAIMASKYGSKTDVIEFIWPENAPGNGAKIGIASQYGLDHVRTSHCLNVQADELYPPKLAEVLKNNWRLWAAKGIECLSIKVLNCEHNLSHFQGGEEWDGKKEGDVWDRGGMHDPVSGLGGAGYNRSEKFFKKCPAIKFQHDGWSVSGCATIHFVKTSYEWPIVHAHDHFRDSLVALRQNAADAIWTDRTGFGNYKYDADKLEQTQEQWYNDSKWKQTTSPFDELLPDFVKPLIGQTSYQVRYELLEQ